jgi:hypothetical protein
MRETICSAPIAQIDVPGPNDNGPSPCDEGPSKRHYLGWLMGLEPTTTRITIWDSTN